MSVETLLARPGDWIYPDLLALPAGPHRYEIVDGGLVVSPAPGFRHEAVIGQLQSVPWSGLPAGLRVLGPVGVRLGRTYRTPMSSSTSERLTRTR